MYYCGISIPTDKEDIDLGSKSNFSPDGNFWFSTWSSCNCSNFSKPSKTVMELPPRYLKGKKE